MADPFLAEIRIVGFNFAPTGWAFCNGQSLPISQNTALFSLLGTIYGGDGKSSFALPNLQGRAPLQAGRGPGLTLRDHGEVGGQAAVTLAAHQMPQHTHTALANTVPAGTLADPGNAGWAQTGGRRGGLPVYASAPAAGGATMSPQALGPAGSSLPHNNMPPYLALSFVIAMQGIYPARP